MAPNNKASVEERDDNGIAASGRFKIQMLLGSLSFVFFFLSFHYFHKGIVRESDPTKWDLMLIYSAFTLPTLVFTMSWARCYLATNHPKWCFVVEMFQASISFLTMTGSIQISIMKDEEENFLCCLGFLLASLILLEITIDDTEDCGVCDMLLALFLTKLNTKHPISVPIVSATSYYSKKVGTFMMKKLKNERAEAKEEEVEKLREELQKSEELREELRKAEELREVKERMDKDVLRDMAACWVATKEMLATGPHESDLKMKYAEFFRMRGLIRTMNERAGVDGEQDKNNNKETLAGLKLPPPPPPLSPVRAVETAPLRLPSKLSLDESSEVKESESEKNSSKESESNEKRSPEDIPDEDFGDFQAAG